MSGYEVGYGKPPVATRFKKGRSGNPKGRPKGSRNKPKADVLAPGKLHALILEHAYREVEVTEGGRTVTLPLADLALRSVFAKAAKGDLRAQKLSVEWLQRAEANEQAEKKARFDGLLTYKL